LPNVRVVQGDGTLTSFDAADVIYVSAGATRPTDVWLDGLSEGGRLIVPLTTNDGFISADPDAPLERRGAMFLFERHTSEVHAKWLSPAGFIPCQSARDARSEAALTEAFKKGGWEHVTRLYRDDTVPEERCWLRTPEWSLAYH
jgi:protein-L-isoaspartate(D-aspartate) O-methyltransferase